MKLTENFTLREFERSATADRLGIDNEVPADLLPNALQVACWLQALRDRLGRSVVVTSGYRSAALNVAVGGSPSSAHCRALAADIQVPGMPAAKLFAFIRQHMADMPADQVIEEFGEWVHVGLAGTPRAQFLIASKAGGKTRYEAAA
jgi:hypothetical protein